MLLRGEYDAIKQALATADIYGYGNLIGHLKRAWAEKLMAGAPDTYMWEQALKATDVPAYPRHWTPEALRDAPLFESPKEG